MLSFLLQNSKTVVQDGLDVLAIQGRDLDLLSSLIFLARHEGFLPAVRGHGFMQCLMDARCFLFVRS